MKDTENTRALLTHIIRMKQQQRVIGSAISRSIAWARNEKSGKSGEDGGVQMTETRIYIGLNDADTGEQLFETEKYLEQLKEVCRRYRVPFSVDVEQGGYYHEDGKYTEETSLILVLIDAEKDIVQGIAKDICTLFHQESVLVTENEIDGYFINRASE